MEGWGWRERERERERGGGEGGKADDKQNKGRVEGGMERGIIRTKLIYLEEV